MKTLFIVVAFLFSVSAFAADSAKGATKSEEKPQMKLAKKSEEKSASKSDSTKSAPAKKEAGKAETAKK